MFVLVNSSLFYLPDVCEISICEGSKPCTPNGMSKREICTQESLARQKNGRKSNLALDTGQDQLSLLSIIIMSFLSSRWHCTYYQLQHLCCPTFQQELSTNISRLIIMLSYCLTNNWLKTFRLLVKTFILGGCHDILAKSRANSGGVFRRDGGSNEYGPSFHWIRIRAESL